MNRILVILAIISIFGCARQYPSPFAAYHGSDGSSGSDGHNSVVSEQDATSLQCPGSSQVLGSFGLVVTAGIDENNNGILDSSEVQSTQVICNGIQGSTGPQGTSGNNGVNGSNGTNGSNGSDGIGIVFTEITATTLQCPAGGNVLIFASDSNQTGVYSISDQNQVSAIVCNGVNGSNGTNGTNGVSPLAPMGPIEACGQASSPWKEVLLCLSNGSVLADFSETMSGQNTRLAFIPAGSYIDTDESGCNFNVSVDGTGSTTVSWNSGSNQYSAWTSGTSFCQAH